MNRIAREQHLAVELVIRIRQVHGQQQVVLAHRRAEQKRPSLIDQEPQPAEETRAFVIEALFAQASGLDIAKAVEHRKRISLLKHARLLIHSRGGGEDVEPVVDLNDLFRGGNHRR